MTKENEGLFTLLGKAIDKDWKRGTSNLKEGLRKMFSSSSDNVEFENAVDNGQLVDWAKSKGVDASEADLIAGLQ